MADANAQELQALRTRIADLEARAQAPAVDVKPFEGLHELSDAIRDNRLNFFLFKKAYPSPLYWKAIAGVILLGWILVGGLIILGETSGPSNFLLK